MTVTADQPPALRQEFAFDRSFQLLDRLLGITPDNAFVAIDDVDFIAQFGRWNVTTPTSNLAGASVTGPYHLLKVVGPPHLSLRDRGLTFATNNGIGVCIQFREPVTGLLPFGLMTHPSLTVTVEHPAALAELVNTIAERTPDVPGTGAVDLGTAQLELHDELRSMSAAELRQRARELGIEAPARLSKAELLALLLDEPTES